MENQKTSPLLKSFSVGGLEKKKSVKTIVITLIVVLLGVGSGYFLSRTSSGSTGPLISLPTENTPANGDSSVDMSEFSDEEAPIGILQKGGLEGEGTHHLERPGGPTKTVYLTSTVLDLESYVGKKVQVWGETLSAVEAGWLMDVVRIKEAN